MCGSRGDDHLQLGGARPQRGGAGGGPWGLGGVSHPGRHGPRGGRAPHRQPAQGGRLLLRLRGGRALQRGAAEGTDHGGPPLPVDIGPIKQLYFLFCLDLTRHR